MTWSGSSDITARRFQYFRVLVGGGEASLRILYPFHDETPLFPDWIIFDLLRARECSALVRVAWSKDRDSLLPHSLRPRLGHGVVP